MKACSDMIHIWNIRQNVRDDIDSQDPGAEIKWAWSNSKFLEPSKAF